MFTLRRAQIERLHQAGARRARSEWLDTLRSHGLEVADDPASGRITAKDKAGGKAFIEAVPRGMMITWGEQAANTKSWSHTFLYNKNRQLEEIIDPAGLRVTFEYDERNRLSTIQRGGLNKFRFLYDEGDNLAGIRYPDDSLFRAMHDDSGRVIETIDRNQNRRRFEYGPEGLLDRIIGPKGETTEYEYGAGGELTTAVTPSRTRYVYKNDPGSGDVTIYVGDAGSPENPVEGEATADGRRLVRISADARTQRRTFQYSGETATYFEYKDGRLAAAVNSECRVNIKYSPAGFVEAEETIVAGDPVPRVVRFKRNALGMLTAIETPDGGTIQYGRDNQHRLRSVRWKKKSGWDTWEIGYELSGALASIRYPNAVVMERKCNAFGYPEFQSLRARADRAIVPDIRWTYNECDRVATETSADTSLRYRYDLEGRLLQIEDGATGSVKESWQLDANGNAERWNGRTCIYNTGDELERMDDEDFHYDPAGNMKKGRCPAGRIECEYNPRGQLLATTVGGVVTRYAYDPFGRRIRKAGPTGTTRFTWAGQWLLSEAETKGDRVARRDYVVAADLGLALGQCVNGWTQYIHYGRRLEPVAMTDEAGELAWQAHWDAFGSAHIDARWQASLALRLQGQYFDSETGLHYNMARYYDPVLGRFLQRDPLGRDGGSWNDYIYCGGDPLNHSDPSGELWPLILGVAAFGAVVGGGIEAYKEYKAKGWKGLDPWKIGKEAAIGGAVAVVGTLAAIGLAEVAAPVAAALVGAAAAGGPAATAVAGGAAYLGEAAVVGYGSGAVSTCADSLLHGDRPTAAQIAQGAKSGGLISMAVAIVAAPVAAIARRLVPAVEEASAAKSVAAGAGEDAPAIASESPGTSPATTGEPSTVGKGASETPCTNGCPVDSISGQVIEWLTDFSLPGALELALKRSYLSGLREAGCFGPGWASSFSQALLDEGGSATWLGKDGDWVRFPRITDVRAGWVPNPDSPRIFLRRARTGFEIRDESRRILRFRTRAGKRWLLDEIADPNGHWIRFTYADGALRGVEHSGGYKLAVEGTAQQLRRVLFLERDAPPQELIRFVYDGRGRLVQTINATGIPFQYRYDDANRLTRWEDRKGNWCAYEYDSEGRCIHTYGPDRMYEYRFAYDSKNRVNSATDAAGNVKKYLYNALGQPVEQVDARGFVTRTVWDRGWNRLQETDGEKRGFRQEFDVAGNLTLFRDALGRTTRIGYNTLGLPETLIDAAGNIWQRKYDERGNLTEAIGPDGATWRYERDGAGNVSRTIDPEGFAREFGYDTHGLLTWFTDAKRNRTTLTRDAMGRVVRRRDVLGRETRFTYSPLGKLMQAELPDHTHLRWEYDAEGNMIRRTGADGRAYQYTYGAFDLLREIEKPSQGKLKLSYDTEARLTAVENEIGRKWRYEYNATGQVVREVDFHGRVQTFDYDASGLCIRHVNGLGEEIRLERDAAGQLLGRSGAVESHFEYDALGQIRTATNGPVSGLARGVAVAFARDAYGRVLREIQNGGAMESVFDRRGLRTKRSVAGMESEWNWDANGQLATLRFSGDDLLEFTYDAAGRETERRLGNGLVLRKEYDAMDRLSYQWVGRASGVPMSGGVKQPGIIERNWRYNENGDPRQITDTRWGSAQYAYDEDGRIARAELRGKVEEFRYDGTGNIASARQQMAETANGQPPRVATFTTRYYGQDGRLERVGDTRYEWDADGRLKEKRVAGQRWRYTWSADGRLTSVQRPDGRRWNYSYDALGRRASKSGFGETAEYRWDGAQLALESKGSGSAPMEWIYEPGTFVPMARKEGAAVSHCVTDQVGSPREMLSRDGAVLWSEQWTVWGSSSREAAGGVSPIRFQGQTLDVESGLHYNFQRYYDPEIGQYLSPDPIGLLGGTRAYGYVHNPLSWVDPLGLQGCNEIRWSQSQKAWVDSNGNIVDHPTSVISPQGTQHILYGDRTGGGHMFGADITNPAAAGKSQFPASWSEADVAHAVSDVATNPASVTVQQTGPAGSLYTNAGAPSRFVTTGTYNGVKINVITEPAGEGIITGFPVQ